MSGSFEAHFEQKVELPVPPHRAEDRPQHRDAASAASSRRTASASTTRSASSAPGSRSRSRSARSRRRASRSRAPWRSYVDPNADGPVIELGPGTGPVTEALVEHGVNPSRLVLVEFNPTSASSAPALSRRRPWCRATPTGCASRSPSYTRHGVVRDRLRPAADDQAAAHAAAAAARRARAAGSRTRRSCSSPTRWCRRSRSSPASRSRPPSASGATCRRRACGSIGTVDLSQCTLRLRGPSSDAVAGSRPKASSGACLAACRSRPPDRRARSADPARRRARWSRGSATASRSTRSAISSPSRAGCRSPTTLIARRQARVSRSEAARHREHGAQGRRERRASSASTFLTVHAYPQTMKAAVEARRGSDLKILAVTVLTSYDDIDLAEAGYSHQRRRAGRAPRPAGARPRRRWPGLLAGGGVAAAARGRPRHAARHARHPARRARRAATRSAS